MESLTELYWEIALNDTTVGMLTAWKLAAQGCAVCLPEARITVTCTFVPYPRRHSRYVLGEQHLVDITCPPLNERERIAQFVGIVRATTWEIPSRSCPSHTPTMLVEYHGPALTLAAIAWLPVCVTPLHPDGCPHAAV